MTLSALTVSEGWEVVKHFLGAAAVTFRCGSEQELQSRMRSDSMGGQEEKLLQGELGALWHPEHLG